MTAASEPGELAIVLHTHMPYVEGFGTWPFGEEWLWEAMATSYLPLLDVLDAGAPVTLSLTPVLCDQLAAPGVGRRFERFIVDVRGETHRVDIDGLRATGEPGLALELERQAADYEHALERFAQREHDLLGALGRHVSWTSSATHAVLALCATEAGVRLQVESGIAAHRARFGDWQGGFWLPECAYAPWLEPLLRDAGVRHSCLDLTDLFGYGSEAHLRPLRTEAGLVVAPLDRATMELVWSDGGYPAAGPYRDYHRHTIHHHCVWGNDGEPYDHAAACALAREHASDFVERIRARSADGGLVVCALDTELLGHWWYEGVVWLEAVIAEAARQGLSLTRLDDALERREPAAAGRLPVCSWGTPRDLSTWDGPAVAELAFAARAAELHVLAAGGAVSDLAARELLALQSSDWAFMATRELAAGYPGERAAAHRQALLAELGGRGVAPGAIRNIAVHARAAMLAGP